MEINGLPAVSVGRREARQALCGTSTLNLSIGTTVSSNQAQTASGGGLGPYEGTINLNDSAIQSNTAAVNGGGTIVDSGTFSAIDPDIRWNVAGANGRGGGR